MCVYAWAYQTDNWRLLYRYNEADLKAEEAEKRVQKLEQELADKEQYNEELQEKYRGIKSELDELSRQFEEL